MSIKISKNASRNLWATSNLNLNTYSKIFKSIPFTAPG